MHPVLFRTASLLTMTVAVALPAHAAEPSPREQLFHYSEEVETPDQVRFEFVRNLADPTPAPGIPFPDIKLADIVNVAKQLWSVVTDNQPSATVSNDYAVALPAGIQAASQLDGFSDLQFHSYRLYGENGLGSVVYDLTYTVVHQYGGSLQGKGQYLATVSVIPASVNVMWGYKLNFKVLSVSTVNVGTTAAPIASIALQTQMSVRSWFKDSIVTTVYQVRGDRSDIQGTVLAPQS